jgi:hypothetical protein
MSRSNPQNSSPNPSTRWFEWRSTDGKFAYWDKEKEARVLVNLPFTFILLDRTATIRGYSKKQRSGIHSNEVRDTRSEPFVVKFFQGGTIAEGVWNDIKDTVTARSGKFGVNAYIAYKEGNALKIGAIQMTGCAVGSWFEFEKAHRKTVEVNGQRVQELYAKAIRVARFENDKTGDVEFNKPIFEITELSAETNAQAVALDKELQEYFKSYFSRTKVQQAQAPANDQEHVPEAPEDYSDGPPESDEVPF